MKAKKVLVTCPKCGHEQEESASAYSTACRKCRQHIRISDVLKPSAAKKQSALRQRTVLCFECGTELTVPSAAQSTMCKRCSCHVDLADYQINHSVSKNFRTKGNMVLEEGGYLFNTVTIAAHVVLKGRFIGSLLAEQSLEIHPTARIQGTFMAEHLIVPASTAFAWPEAVNVNGADIAGEWVGSLVGTGTITLRSTARFFGEVQSNHLVIEEGAVFVGQAKVGGDQKKSPRKSRTASKANTAKRTR